MKERLFKSTGITNNYMESNWQDGVYSAVGRVVQTPYMNMKVSLDPRTALSKRGRGCRNTPYTLRGFESAS